MVVMSIRRFIINTGSRLRTTVHYTHIIIFIIDKNIVQGTRPPPILSHGCRNIQTRQVHEQMVNFNLYC